MSSIATDAVGGVHPARDEHVRAFSSRTRWRRAAAIVAVGTFAVLALAATWPVTFGSREELFEIPKGTWARRMAGDKHEILPSEIDLVVGVHDVLTLKNSDDVPQIFGPTLLMPGQTFRLPFTTPSQNYFNCTAHANGQLLVSVEPAPTSPWARLRWRARRLTRSALSGLAAHGGHEAE